MRFVPDYTMDILTEEAFPVAIRQIEERLAACRVSGFFDAFDGEKLFYEYFLAENSRASIVLVHGLSEFTKKFYEITFYFLNQGYNVFLYDQRCHGMSCRLTDRIDVIHVDDFADYEKDLATFIDTVVKPAEDKPLYLYSHSMGGAVCAMYMANHPKAIVKAVMSAPLIDPVASPLPRWFIRPGLRIGGLIFGKKTKFALSSEFNPNHPFEKAGDASHNRFMHNLTMRRQEPMYQSTPMSYGWVYQSLILCSRLLKKGFVEQIETPILLFSAERDTVVKIDAQHRFAARCRTCQLWTLKDATHAILSGTQDTITEHIRMTMDFYRD